MLMMQTQAQQTVHLMDSGGRHLGEILIDRTEDQLVFGKFIPGPAFPMVEHLFRAFEEAVELQALGAVDDLDAQVAALGLHLRSSDDLQDIQIYDVQIWSEGGLTFRLGSSVVPSATGGPEAVQPAVESEVLSTPR